MGVREAILARPGLATSLLYCLLRAGGAGYERAELPHMWSVCSLAVWSATGTAGRSPLSGDFQGRHPLSCGGWEEGGSGRGRPLMEFQ